MNGNEVVKSAITDFTKKRNGNDDDNSGKRRKLLTMIITATMIILKCLYEQLRRIPIAFRVYCGDAAKKKGIRTQPGGKTTHI